LKSKEKEKGSNKNAMVNKALLGAKPTVSLRKYTIGKPASRNASPNESLCFKKNFILT
jgi:hypothetical protein